MEITFLFYIGGWNSGSERFSVMAADPNKRKTFIDSLMPFLAMYGFEGVDLDWEYPGDREGSDPEHDKDNFSVLVCTKTSLFSTLQTTDVSSLYIDLSSDLRYRQQTSLV